MTDKVPEYIEGVGWRYDIEHSMLRRMCNHDYQSRCIYMLTLTLADRSKHLLGEVRWNVSGGCSSSATSHDAVFTPTPLGTLVEAEWHALTTRYPQLEIMRLQLMPDHLHIILFVHERIAKPLGKLVGIVKNRSNKHYWKQLTEQGFLAPKGQETPPPLFSENFQDTILMHEGQLGAMMKYVDENPYRALIKRGNPELFHIVSELKIGNQVFSAIGNRWLINRGVRMQVRCHNNTSERSLKLIAKQKEYILDRGQKGGVVVSPCISAGEKEIARAALDAGVPLIVILENGFSPMYKPPGKYFEACANGLLLMLAPWPYHTEKRAITREQCLQLNAMAYAISNEPWTREMEEKLIIMNHI